MTEPLAYNRLADHLAGMGVRGRYQGGALRVPGLCHDGDAPGTVAISRGSTGVVIHCHKCNDNSGFLEAIGWTTADLFDEPLERTRDRPMDDQWIPCQTRDKAHRRVAQYVYRDENKLTVHGVTRCDHKCFAQWRPEPSTKSGRRWSLNDGDGKRLVRVVPYRLPQILEARETDRVVWIAEGEKDVHALVDHGLVATCNAGGAGKWTAEHAQFLEGMDITIVADRDEPGQRHAKEVVDTLRNLARSVYVVQALTGKDAADHFEAGHKDSQFVQVWAPIPHPGDAVVTA
ncbi:toprim domain-containing protein [Streptomyces sp. NPDC047990]|uniref:toprim domain-containing protein n=1 Tax=Streptomyces sp. NPDC047990 TaxID=3365496 RepID=UPI0037163B57